MSGLNKVSSSHSRKDKASVLKLSLESRDSDNYARAATSLSLLHHAMELR